MTLILLLVIMAAVLWRLETSDRPRHRGWAGRGLPGSRDRPGGPQSNGGTAV